MFIPSWAIVILGIAIVVGMNQARKEGREYMRKYMEKQQEADARFAENYNNSEDGEKNRAMVRNINKMAHQNGNQKI